MGARWGIVVSEPVTPRPSPDPPRDERNGTRPTAVLVHLSGDLRGTSLRLQGDRLAIGTAEGAPIRLRAHEESVGPEHAELVREGSTWRLEVEPGRSVWVDGERVESRRLEHGDELLVGRTRLVVTHAGVPADSPGAMGWRMALDELERRLASAG